MVQGSAAPYPNAFASVVENAFAHIFTVATSTTQNPVLDIAVSTIGGKDWARVAVGTTTASGPGANWPFTVQGEIYSTKRTLMCDNPGNMSGLTADSVEGLCGGMTFDEDGQGATDSNTVNGASVMQMPAVQMWVGATAVPTASAAAGDGAGISVGVGPNLGWSYASSSPAFEALISASSTNASSSIIVAGLSIATRNNQDYSVIPTSGFYFTASSTASTGNWYAVAREVSGSQVFTDTGVASTTADGLTAVTWQRMRIKIVPNLTDGSNTGYFYINDALVATRTTTRPSIYGTLQPTVYLGKTVAGNAIPMYVAYIRAWADLLPGQNN